MRVYIAPLGIGYGHASRMLNLARRLSGEGFDVAISAYGDAARFYSSMTDLEEITLYIGGEEVSWVQNRDGSPNLRATLMKPKQLRLFIRHVMREVRNLDEFSPDIVVSDSKPSSLLAAIFKEVPLVTVLNQPKLLVRPFVEEALSRVSKYSSKIEKGVRKLAIVINKLADVATTRLWALSSAAVIADFPPPYNISSYQTSGLPDILRLRAVYSGPLIDLECKDARYTGGRDLVLIMASGPEGERKYLVETMIEVLRKIPEDLSDLKFVISRGEPGNKSSYKLSDNVTVVNWLDDKWEYFSRARVVVSRAGHTTISEVLLCGVPLILIPVPGHTEKEENAKSVVRIGAGLIVAQASLKNDFFEALRRVLRDKTYSEKAQKFREKFSDWDFMDRAISAVFSALQ